MRAITIFSLGLSFCSALAQTWISGCGGETNAGAPDHPSDDGALDALASDGPGSSSDVTADASPDRGSDGGAANDAADAADTPDGSLDDGAICNSILVDAAWIGVQLYAGRPPAATGGAVLDGVYVLTEHRIYLGDASTSIDASWYHEREIWVATGGVFQRAFESNLEGGTTPPRTRFTLDVDGSDVTYLVSCPQPISRGGQFSATPTEFRAVGPSEVAFYSRQ